MSLGTSFKVSESQACLVAPCLLLLLLDPEVELPDPSPARVCLHATMLPSVTIIPTQLNVFLYKDCHEHGENPNASSYLDFLL